MRAQQNPSGISPNRAFSNTKTAGSAPIAGRMIAGAYPVERDDRPRGAG
jgi:hypothetical protein